MRGFTDIHSHFIYGLDDGARSRSDMEHMIDAANENGILDLFATPHVVPGVKPFDYDLYLKHLNAARAYCQQMQYPIEIYAGAEIMYTPAISRYASEGELPTMGGSDKILLEFVPNIKLSEMEEAIEMMERSGYVTIMAHVERYDCLMHGNTARKFKADHDVRYQVNCSTIVSGGGFFRDRHIDSLLKDEKIDFIASDAHDCKNRPFMMKSAYDTLRKKYNSKYVDKVVGMVVI